MENQGTCSRARILLVEDDPTMRQAIKLLLASDDYVLDEAADGHEARDKLAAGAYDLVICDLFLPDTTGLETVRRCRAAHPTLVMTGFGDSETARLARAEAGELYLEKPFSPASLKNKIERALGRQPRKTDRS